MEKDFNEYKKLSNKQSVEEVSVERAVKATIQTVFDKGFFDKYANAVEVPKHFLFVER